MPIFKIFFSRNKETERFVDFITEGYQRLGFTIWIMKIVEEEGVEFYLGFRDGDEVKEEIKRNFGSELFISLNPKILNPSVNLRKRFGSVFFLNINILDQEIKVKDVALDLFERLESIGFAPNLITRCGNSINLFYKIKHPIEIEKWLEYEKKIIKFFEIFVGMIKLTRFDVDDGVASEELFVRVAGIRDFLSKTRVEVLKENYANLYDLEYLDKIFDRFLLSEANKSEEFGMIENEIKQEVSEENKLDSVIDQRDEKREDENALKDETYEFKIVYGFDVNRKGEQEEKNEREVRMGCVEKFSQDCLIYNPNSMIRKDDLYKAYLEYCNSKKIKPYPKANFIRILRKLYPITLKRKTINWHKFTCVQGLELKKEISLK